LNCQYDLRRLSAHRCPECGRGFDPENRASWAASPTRRLLRRRVGAVGMSWPLIVFGMCHLTRLAAWISLGRPPIAYRDDPTSINFFVTTLYILTEVCMLAFPIAYFLTIASVVSILEKRRAFFVARAALLIAFITLCWMGGFYLIRNAFDIAWFAD
ncbi:MAG: hypothetical protein KDA33_03840, partial [Phycisphaerales bacterium]|nr:hypothetical protein [Phycisphaerales bacterium]